MAKKNYWSSNKYNDMSLADRNKQLETCLIDCVNHIKSLQTFPPGEYTYDIGEFIMGDARRLLESSGPVKQTRTASLMSIISDLREKLNKLKVV